MPRKPDGNGRLDEAMTALVQAQAMLVQNHTSLQQVLVQDHTGLQQATATLQLAMATLVQNQALAQKSFQELKDRIDQKFAEIDRRFDNVEAFLVKMSAELPERVFGFAQTHKKPN